MFAPGTAGQGKWAWRGDQGQWVTYPPLLNDLIEKAFISGQPACSFSSAEGRKYRLDFGAMIQTNLATRGPRPTRRFLKSASGGPSTPGSMVQVCEASSPSKVMASSPSSSPCPSSLSPLGAAIDLGSFMAGLKLPTAPVWVGSKPTAHSTSTTLKFEVPKDKQELYPGQCMLFIVPEAYRSVLVRSVTLAHRKDDKYTTTVDEKGWDSEPVYNTVTGIKGEKGRYIWRDQYGSMKFAEPRKEHDPEHEHLHDCRCTSSGARFCWR